MTDPPRPLRGPTDVRSVMLTGLFLFALVAALRLGRAVILPIVIALLLSFLLAPLVRGLHRLRLPNAVGAAVVLLTLIAALAIGAIWLAVPAGEWMEQLPETARELEFKLREVRRPLEKVSEATEQVQAMADAASSGPPLVEVRKPTIGESLASGTRTLALAAVIVAVLLYYLLASGDRLMQKVVRMPSAAADRRRTVEIFQRIRADISSYLLTITSVNLGLGAAVGVSMWLLGMPNPILWGVMAALLNYVPYIGAIVGIVIVLLAAVVTFDSLGAVLAPAIVYLVLTNVEAYIVTPLVLGARLTLNPAVIFVGLIFWTWLWGVPGALLAVPMLVVVKILCDRVDGWQPVGEFLGR